MDSTNEWKEQQPGKSLWNADGAENDGSDPDGDYEVNVMSYSKLLQFFKMSAYLQLDGFVDTDYYLSEGEDEVTGARKDDDNVQITGKYQ